MRSAVADYEVLSETGDGEFVARAPDRLGLREAATVLVRELSVDAAGWPALTAAVRRMATIGSEHLLRLVEVGPDLDPAGAGVYLVAELVSGGTLRNPATPLDTAARVGAIAGAARGAHALHQAGIAHGSINAGAVYLTDRGGVLGPPAWDTPEGAVAHIKGWEELVTVDPQLLRGDPPSRSSDVWALGATLYAELSREPLYAGIETDQAVTAVQRILFGRPSVDPGLPHGLGSVFEACFDPDPGRRPGTAEELANELEKALAADASQ